MTFGVLGSEAKVQVSGCSARRGHGTCASLAPSARYGPCLAAAVIAALPLDDGRIHTSVVAGEKGQPGGKLPAGLGFRV